MIRDDPEMSARAMAEEMHADLAFGGEATEAALERLSPLRTRKPNLVAVPPLRARPDFEQLSRAMRRAEETRDRTRRGVAEQLSRTFNTALAIHPDTLRRAAAELIEARSAVDHARRGRPAAPDRAARRIRAGGSGGLTAAGLAISALGALPVGVVVAAVGVVSGTIALTVSRRAVLASIPDLEARELAARRRWEQLAGVGADPSHVEAVMHRYDPQHRAVTDLLINSPVVRAADQLALHHRMAWVQAWRVEVGDDAALAPAPVPVLDLTAVEAEAPEQPKTLVVVGPYTELSEERARSLHRRLLTLPGGNRVIVVLGPDAVGKKPTVVDLRDPVDVTS